MPSLFDNGIGYALSMTIFHSLWQGLLIFIVVRSITMFIPGEKSLWRYRVNAVGMLSLFIAGITTFIVLAGTETTLSYQEGVRVSAMSPSTSTENVFSIASFVTSFIAAYNSWFVALWFAGTSLFLLRLTGSWWLIHRICAKAKPVVNDWSVRIGDISRKLELPTQVRLLESLQVQAPIVIGFIKPVIVVPAGLFSGLGPDQIEAILIHELVHIKRYDYIINLVQSVLEALFFFNPFVWLLSAQMRTEREHCCDDAVIVYGGNTRAYVHALATLEEARYAGGGLALSLAGNKNQLLNRIKRLMEKSVRTYSIRERILPFALLIIGLVCASWFSIQSDTTVEAEKESALAQDTTKRKRQLSHMSPTDVIAPPSVIDPIEDMEAPPMADLEPAPLPDFDFDFNFDMEPFMMDSIPPQRWKAFEEEFHTKFSERFGDFYANNEKEIRKFMDEFQTKFPEKFNDEWVKNMEANVQVHAKHAEEHARRAAEHATKMIPHEAEMKAWEAKMKVWEEKNAAHMKVMEEKMKKMDAQMKAFDKELREQLILDGYIGKDETFKNIHWQDNGKIEVNGKEIRESDRKKYDALHKKYFTHKGEIQFEE